MFDTARKNLCTGTTVAVGVAVTFLLKFNPLYCPHSGAMVCPSKVEAISKVVQKYAGGGVATIIAGIGASVSGLFESAYKYFFPEDINIIEVAKKFHEGTSADEHFIMPKDGGYIFGKGGVDYFEAGEGEDNFFFSMCSLKNETTIKNFDSNHDKVYIFCSLKEVELDELSVEYNKETNTTNLTISGKFDPRTISLNGEHPGIIADVVLNQRYNYVVGEIEKQEEI